MLLAVAQFAVTPPCALAMPTQKELAEVQPLVNELMSSLVKDLKAKKITAAEVGDGAMAFVDEAESLAAKFTLLKSAVSYYTKSKDYDKAADAIDSILELVPDIPPKALYEITSKATANASPRLVALNNMAKNRTAAMSKLKTIEKELKKNPGDTGLKRMHAELLAATGDWESALKEFAMLGGAIGKQASADADATGDSSELAEFWWNYKPVVAEAKDAIRQHASGLYRNAIEEGNLSGLKKTLAEKRIAEVEGQVASGSGPKRMAVLNAKLKKGLVGYWQFDGNANDATKNRNNGTEHGVVPTADRYGNAKGAYNFSGSGYVEVPDAPTLNMTQAMTLTVWIKPTRWWGDWIAVVQKGTQKQVCYQMEINAQNFVAFRWSGWLVRCQQQVAELNKWQQVVITYERGANTCLYRNGVLIGKSQFNEPLPHYSGSLYIGYDPLGGDEYFFGDMDDVRLYNRALSEKEVQELYKAESAGVGK